MTYVALYRATTYLRTTVSSVQPKAIQRRASASQVHVAVGASLSILFLSLQLRVANWRGRADRGRGWLFLFAVCCATCTVGQVVRLA